MLLHFFLPYLREEFEKILHNIDFPLNWPTPNKAHLLTDKNTLSLGSLLHSLHCGAYFKMYHATYLECVNIVFNILVSILNIMKLVFPLSSQVTNYQTWKNIAVCTNITQSLSLSYVFLLSNHVENLHYRGNSISQ